MCIAAIAWDAHPDWLMILAGNRDEYHARPAAALAAWADDSAIIAGRDLEAGGTWLGISEAGRFALVTNFRALGFPQPDRASRGALVTDMLAGRAPEALDRYNPFNLLIAHPGGAAVWSNYPGESRLPLPAGIHGLSNGDFTRPWPKTRRLTGALGQWLASGSGNRAALFDALRDDTEPDAPAHGDDGPDTPFSPVFIRNPVYGTRCSTVVAIARDGQGEIAERRFDAEGRLTGETVLAFRWPTA